MDHSASAPVLQDSDYYMPCHGVGDTGHANRTVQGKFSTDTGKNSSRINQIIKQAEKYPGPGQYVKHSSWDGGWGCHGGNRFPPKGKDSIGAHEYKPMHNFPECRTYENKIIANPSTGPDALYASLSNASKSNLSTRPRILQGKIAPPGKKRSFLDQAEKHGKDVPDPGAYQWKPEHVGKSGSASRSKLNPKIIKICEWAKESVKTVSKKEKVEEIACNHYSPNWVQAEERIPNYSVPKEDGANFLDRAVKEKMLQSYSAKIQTFSGKVPRPLPGPEHYEIQNFDMKKTSRGTMHLQLRGLTRSPASGYF